MASLAGDPRAQSIEGWHHAYEDCLDNRAWGGTGDFPNLGNAFCGLFFRGLALSPESAGAARLSDARLSASSSIDFGLYSHRRALVRRSADLVFHTATAGEVRTKPVKVF